MAGKKYLKKKSDIEKTNKGASIKIKGCYIRGGYYEKNIIYFSYDYDVGLRKRDGAERDCKGKKL